MVELYRKHRPKKLGEIFGQKAACRALLGMIKDDNVPHAILFSGPSGVGKTTFARILKTRLKCHDVDYSEINAASSRGIDTVRDIQKVVGLAPIEDGGSRIWVIDECAKLTNDAQNAMLKLLEDTPGHAYFILATTEPDKVIKTVRNRCTEIKLSPLTEEEIKSLLSHVLDKEQKKLDARVVDKIVEVVEGSARKALVVLEEILGIEGAQPQLDAIDRTDSRRQAIDLCRLLFKKATWKEVAAVIKGIEEEPETVRRMVLGYASQVLLNGGSARAQLVLQVFRDHWYDCGRAGLVTSAYEVTVTK